MTRALIALLVLVSSAASAYAGNIDALLDKGEFSLRHRDYAAALVFFDQAVKEMPGNVHAHIGRQEASRLAEKADDLFSEYKARWDRTPTDPDAAYLYSRLLLPEPALKVLDGAKHPSFFVHLQRAKCLLASGQGTGSKEADAAAAACPKEPRALGLLAGFYEDALVLDKALDYFEQALAITPGRLEALEGKGNVLRLMGKLDVALKVLSEASAMDKKDPEILYRLGLTHFDRGEANLAIKTYNDGLGLDRQDMDMLLALGEAYILGEKLPDAESRFRIVVERFPKRVDARRRLAYAYELQDKNDEALEQYGAIIKLEPLSRRTSACHISVGWILLKKGKYDQATRSFRQAMDLDKDNVLPLFFIGYTYDQMGRWQEAADTYEQVIKKDKEFARAYNNLGLDQNLLGKASKALKNLKKAVELDPDNIEYNLNLADTYYDAKKYKDAAKAYADVLALDEKVLDAWTGLGRAQNGQKNYKQAVDAYESAIEVDPEDEDLHLIVALIYHERLKEYQKALDSYQKFVELGGADPMVEGWMEDCRKRIK